MNKAATTLERVGVTGAILGTGATWLFGEWEVGIQILTTTMALDYGLGLLWGFKNCELNSKIAFYGLKRKLTVIFILMFAVQLDRMMGQGWIFRTLVIYFYTTMEGLSIVETAGKFGVPIPQKLKQALEQLHEESNKGSIAEKYKEETKKK